MILTLDFETFYEYGYELSRMHTLEYVRDERFKAHGAAVKIDDQETKWVPGSDMQSFLDGLPEDVTLVCHNTYFDGLILFTHYQYIPALYADTLSMSRGLLPHAPEHSLDYLCELLGIGKKIPEVLGLTKGLRDLPAELEKALAAYAKHDVELTYKLYLRLRDAIPEGELKLIDLTLRWGCRPILHVDLPRAKAALDAAVTEREAAIAASGTSLEVLSSQSKFAALLESLGIEIPMKPNSKGKMIPALAKDDLGFRALQANYPEQKTLFAGRLAAKSTIDVTRIKRVIEIGSRGTLPMPLKYYGAHTGRWSGADGLNPQNFPRGSELRRSLIAPPGYVILVADQKQIELRLNLWFCGEENWLQVLRAGNDVYTASAANYFKIPYETVTEAQRFFGKTMELGLGYKMGWKKFRDTSLLKGIYLTDEEAYAAVQSYRFAHIQINRKWHDLDNQLPLMSDDPHYRDVDTPVEYLHERILLPNNMSIDYSNLSHTGDHWTYGYGAKTKFIYGGKMLENIIQALGRIVLSEHILEIEASGITTVSSTHDEPIMVVRESEVEAAAAEVRRIMTKPPAWAPDLPVDVDISWAKEYSK